MKNIDKNNMTPLSQAGDDGIDGYGVDHSDFSIRDELEYQMSHQNANGGTTNLNQDDESQDIWGKFFGGKDEKTKNQNCFMTFDGENLNLYDDQGLYDSLEAMSGNRKYQSKQYQNIANRGPIPEGTHHVPQSRRQTISPIDAIIGSLTKLLKVKRGKWRGGLPSWGLRRAWLEPDPSTNTFGRTDFSIHGGSEKGSGGCIDIPWQTGKLSDYLDNCQERVPVYVKYKKGF